MLTYWMNIRIWYHISKKKNHENSQLRSSSKRCKVITFFVQMNEHKEEEKMKQYVEDVKFTAQEDIVRM